MDTTKYVDELWNKNIVECLDAIKEADEALETINRDMFNDIARVSFDVAFNGGDITTIKRVLKNFEARYKKEREVKHMPGSYRSAKSVVLNAIRAGVRLVEGEEVRGKTAIEREIKQELKPKTKRVDDYVAQARYELGHTCPTKIGEAKDKEQLAHDLDRIESLVSNIRKLYL